MAINVITDGRISGMSVLGSEGESQEWYSGGSFGNYRVGKFQVTFQLLR